MDIKTAPKSLGESSRKYGVCELCRMDVSEVFIVPVGQDYAFGHKGCLLKVAASGGKVN